MSNQTPEERFDDLKDFFRMAEGMESPIKRQLIQIMSANGQPVIRDATEALRQAELLLMRKQTHQTSIGQLLGGTMTFLDEFIREYDGAVITSDFVRRAKELRGRFRLEFKAHKL